MLIRPSPELIICLQPTESLHRRHTVRPGREIRSVGAASHCRKGQDDLAVRACCMRPGRAAAGPGYAPGPLYGSGVCIAAAPLTGFGAEPRHTWRLQPAWRAGAEGVV